MQRYTRVGDCNEIRPSNFRSIFVIDSPQHSLGYSTMRKQSSIYSPPPANRPKYGTTENEALCEAAARKVRDAISIPSKRTRETGLEANIIPQLTGFSPDEIIPLASSWGETAVCDAYIEILVRLSEYDDKGNRRAEQSIKRILLTEASRAEFQREDAEFWQTVAAGLRQRVAERPKRSPGRPQNKNFARQLLDKTVENLRTELKTRGLGELAAKILVPRQVTKEWDSKPDVVTGLDTVLGAVHVAAQIAGVELPHGALKSALDDTRRAERRRRKNSPVKSN